MTFTEADLEPSQTSMRLFCENSQRLKAAAHFRKKTPLQMFDWILNTSMKFTDENLDLGAKPIQFFHKH